MTVGRMNKILMQNLLIAQKYKYIRKPFAWALYETWKEVDRIEKVREKNE